MRVNWRNRFKIRLIRQSLNDRQRINFDVLPQGLLVAGLVKLTMVHPT